MHPPRPVRVVLVGFGPVGARFAEELLPEVVAGRVDLTVVGAEAGDPYNRVLVAELAVGLTERDDIVLADSDELRASGVDVRTSVRVVAIDREARTVQLDDGAELAYDRLVLATGARANIPTLSGVARTTRDQTTLGRLGHAAIGTDDALPAGVTVVRDLADADTIGRAVAAKQHIVVLGAGVLGLEFALLAARHGAAVSVVHTGAFPMPRNLDRGGGSVLSRALRTRGITLLAHSPAEGVAFHTEDDGTTRFDALFTADGKHIHGDLLVLSCGVGARAELAVTAGLRTESGIVVDHDLRSWTDPRIYAIGDCAHIVGNDGQTDTARLGGAPAGLIGPGWRQAEWLAARFAADVTGVEHSDAPPTERASVVMLKGEGIDAVSAGAISAEPWDSRTGDVEPPNVALWADPEHGRYVKMVTRDGVLEGFVSVGMPRASAELTMLFERGGELPSDRSLLLRLDAPDEPVASGAAAGPEAIICTCNAVTAGTIGAAWDAGNTTVACIGKATRAGTGCGGCKDRIERIIADRESTLGTPPALEVTA